MVLIDQIQLETSLVCHNKAALGWLCGERGAGEKRLKASAFGVVGLAELGQKSFKIRLWNQGHGAAAPTRS